VGKSHSAKKGTIFQLPTLQNELPGVLMKWLVSRSMCEDYGFGDLFEGVVAFPS
jgi:hypothetical protein